MNRRQFLTFMGVGAVASYLPVALVACSRNNNPTEESNTVESLITLGTLTELAQQGQLSQEDILVISSPNDPKTMIAVNSTCPHAGCAVTWDKDQNLFICPCHDSQFDSEGKVTQGPADEPLTIYGTKLEGETILVQKS